MSFRAFIPFRPQALPGNKMGAVRYAAGALLALSLVWSAGFLAFLVISWPADDGNSSPRKVDAIVVLTGGGGRIQAGLGLLRAGLAPRMYISGLGVEPGPFLARIGVSPSLAGRIDVGMARTTFENVQETHAWAKQAHVQSIILVTAFHHMPRGLLLFENRMPEARILPYRVIPRRLGTFRQWLTPRNLQLLIGEYHKLVATWLDTKLRIGLWSA